MRKTLLGFAWGLFAFCFIAGLAPTGNYAPINNPAFTGTLTLPTTVAGTPTWSSNQAITLSTAAQPNVTSIGTLGALSASSVLGAPTSTGTSSFQFYDSTTFATGVGGWINFIGKYNAGGSYAEFGAIQGAKANNTDGNYQGDLVLFARANGSSAFTEGIRVKTTGVNVLGTTTNDNAATGNVGEYVSASVVQGSATALTTATPKTVTSISLTAGDWDVTAIGALTGASTGTEFDVAIGTTTNSLTGTVLGNTRCQTPTVSLTGADASLMIPAVRVSISSTTTYYLIVQETFTVGSPGAYGRISARRVR